jgi:hypothetical protein
MKRFWIMLLAIAMALVIALPAGAGRPEINCDKHPDKPECTSDPEPPAVVVVCEFDDNGVLQNWWEQSLSAPYSCEWTTTDREQFTFELAPGSGAEDGKGTVLRPHLFVTDAYPYGDKCFEQVENGWHTFKSGEPYVWGPFTLPTVGECDSGGTNVTDPEPDGPDVFRLLISARTVKGATLEVTLKQP